MGRKPIYEEIAAEFRAAIERGDYQPGQQMPTLVEAAAARGVNKFTVRDAYTRLTEEGLLIQRERVGYFVRGGGRRLPVRAWRDVNERLDTWSVDMANHGHEPETTIEVIVRRPPARVADLLGSDCTAVVRRVQYFMGGKLAQTAELYVVRALAEGTPLMEPDDIQPTVYDLFASLDRAVVEETDAVTSRPASSVERAAYALPVPAVIQEIHRVGLDATGAPVFAQVVTQPGEDYELVYSRTLPTFTQKITT
jgi:GntR family transcriptional regulator